LKLDDSKYVFKGAMLSAILFLCSFLISAVFDGAAIIHGQMWLVITTVYMIFLLSMSITMFGLRMQKQNLVPFLLGSLVTRLLLGIIILGVLLWQAEKNREVLALNFMAVYLCFMAFEIKSSIANLRQFFEKGRDNEHFQT